MLTKKKQAMISLDLTKLDIMHPYYLPLRTIYNSSFSICCQQDINITIGVNSVIDIMVKALNNQT